MENLVNFIDFISHILDLYNQMRDVSKDKSHEIEQKCRDIDNLKIEKVYEQKYNLINKLLQCYSHSSRSFITRTTITEYNYEYRVDQIEDIIKEFNELFAYLYIEYDGHCKDIDDLMSEMRCFENIWREYFYCLCNENDDKDEWYNKLIEKSINLEIKLMDILSEIRNNMAR